VSGAAIALGLVLQLQAGDLATHDGRCGRVTYIDRGAGVPMVWLDPVPLGDPPRGFIRAPLAQLVRGCSPLPINDSDSCLQKSSAFASAPFARAQRQAFA